MRNSLAVLQILIIPIIIYLVSQRTRNYLLVGIVLLIVSIIISFTEWLYAKHARRDQESFLRPYADKILAVSLLLWLTATKIFPLSVLVILIARDIIVSVIRFMATRDNILLGKQWSGKLITISELSLVFLILVQNFLQQNAVHNWLPALTAIVQIVTIITAVLAMTSIIDYSSNYSYNIRQKKGPGTVLDKEKLLILANPKSGGFNDHYRKHLLKVFAKRRKARIIFLPKTKDIFAEVEEKIRDYQQIIIAGGDGSFESALNHDIFKDKSLGFFPLGAGNSYYSYFYKGKRFEYLRSRFKFKEVLLDILELGFNQKKIQTTFLSLGIDAEVVKNIKSIQNHNLADYVTASLKVVLGPRLAYTIHCLVEDRIYRWENCFNLIISKIPFIGYGLRSTIGKVDSDDGVILGLANVNTHSSWFNKGLRIWAIIFTQLGLNKAPLIPFKGKVFTIESRTEFPLQAGGDFLGYTTKLNVAVKRKQKVLMI